MAQRINLIGQRFGSWTVIDHAERDSGHRAQWLCECDCGVQRIVGCYELRSGHSTGCGCVADKRTTTRERRPFFDLTGQRFGKLAVTRQAEELPKMRQWLCRCDCGTERVFSELQLITHGIQSCGCVNGKTRPPERHGMSGTREYRCWRNMIHRCYNQSSGNFAQYGGRGITVCGQWHASFLAFQADVGNAPSPVHTLDRIDGTGNYEPGNVRWATPTEQSRNRSSSLIIEFEGESHTAAEWADIKGMSRLALYQRIRKGWAVDDALTAPVDKSRKRPGHQPAPTTSASKSPA